MTKEIYEWVGMSELFHCLQLSWGQGFTGSYIRRYSKERCFFFFFKTRVRMINPYTSYSLPFLCCYQKQKWVSLRWTSEGRCIAQVFACQYYAALSVGLPCHLNDHAPLGVNRQRKLSLSISPVATSSQLAVTGVMACYVKEVTRGPQIYLQR